jgi:hypothetical protein
MDTGNESPGGREDRVSETHILQVDAPMSDSCHSERDLSHERQVTPSSSIERPHGDAGRGEFVLGGCRGGETLIFYRETRTICWSTCGNVFTLTNYHLSPLPQTLKMVMRTPDEVSCAMRAGRENSHLNTLGESWRVAGGRVETLDFFLTFATNIVPFAVSKSSHEGAGQDQGKFDSGRRRGETLDILHRNARRSAATAWVPSPATAWGA